jgi:hypothetical protein
MTFRLIDDVLSVDNPLFTKYVKKSDEEGGIYPKELELNDTATDAKKVQFLGMEIERC